MSVTSDCIQQSSCNYEAEGTKHSYERCSWVGGMELQSCNTIIYNCRLRTHAERSQNTNWAYVQAERVASEFYSVPTWKQSGGIVLQMWHLCIWAILVADRLGLAQFIYKGA